MAPLESGMKVESETPLKKSDEKAIMTQATQNQTQTQTETADEHQSIVFQPQHLTLPKCEVPEKEIMGPIEQFLVNAMKDVDGTNYNAVLQNVRRPDDAAMTYRMLIALRTTQGVLHQLVTGDSHVRLLHLILRFDPFFIPKRLKGNAEYGQLVNSLKLTTAWLHLLVNLVSANSVYVPSVMKAIWNQIKIGTSNKGRTLLHAALVSILKLCPKGSSDLFKVMQTNSPFSGQSKEILLDYACTCFGVTHYAPTLHGPVLELLVEKALEMDVEIKIGLHGDVSIDTDKFVKPDDDDLFELDLDETPKPAAPKTKSELQARIDSTAEKVRNCNTLCVRVSREMCLNHIIKNRSHTLVISQLDGLMLLIMQHLREFVHKDLKRNARRAYHMMAPIFERLILPTYRSKFVQFIMLLVCGMDQQEEYNEIYRDFCATLLQVVVDPHKAIVTRQSAACYLASFVSRSNFVCAETSCESVCALLRFAETYMDAIATLPIVSYKSQCEMHSLFYTVCQASFYVMCFRNEAIKYYRDAVEWHESNTMSDEEPPFPELSLIDIGPERWSRLCRHRLQPLRFCLESVREEFLNVCLYHELMKPDLVEQLSSPDSCRSDTTRTTSAIKRRGRPLAFNRKRRQGGVGGLGKGSNPLDSFFPFDPYLLRRSHHFIDPFYRHWEGIAVEDDQEIENLPDLQLDEEMENLPDLQQDEADDDDDDDDEDDESDLEEKHEHMAVSLESQAMFENMPSAAAPSKDEWTNALRRPRGHSFGGSVGSDW